MEICTIVPIYNVEKYLDQALNSLVNQTFKNIKIICINDCSTDSSPEILEKYAKLDSRITVINNEENLGLGASRNVGLDYVLKNCPNDGEQYIHFLDSDDYLELNCYETLVSDLENNGKVDVLCFSFKQYEYKKRLIWKPEFKHKDLINKNVNIDTNTNILDNWANSVWSKIYSTNFVKANNIRFLRQRFPEDIDFSLSVVLKAKTIRFIPFYLLVYRHARPNSMTAEYSKLSKAMVEVYFSCKNLCRNLNADLRSKLMSTKTETLYYVLRAAYYKKTITYEELVNIISKVNIEEMYTLVESDWYYRWNLDIKRLSKQSFVIKYFIKKHFPTFLKMLKKR